MFINVLSLFMKHCVPYILTSTKKLKLNQNYEAQQKYDLK